ncbi:MAG: 2-hydroxychromene-2-carboxylate isomerase [Gammaproteobacteria bacterium]|nr:2-hydroxychromene-2-carboxylate isomerase [Gammaproteobacteria bacterium]
MPKTIEVEFFYDCSSPWTYFAFTRMVPLAERLGLPVRWRPILVGGVFNAVNQQVYAARQDMFTNPANSRKMAYYLKDLGDWAALCGVTAVMPPGHPISSVRAMRGAFYAEEQGLLLPYSAAVFASYWGGVAPDITSDAVLLDICLEVGLDAEGFFNAIASPAYKDLLRRNTDELIERGGFGSPTIFINGDDMYFGNDRLPLVEHRLRQLLAV